jgi:auxin efflux carrier family protein
MGVGVLAVKTLKLPQWATSSCALNSTTSLPLLLIQSLRTTGVLSSLVVGDESNSDTIQGTTSYFLVCSIVGNSMTFALRPRLMDAENTPDDHDHDQSRKDEDENENENADADEEQGERPNGEQTDGAGDSDEQTLLLSRGVQDANGGVQ